MLTIQILVDLVGGLLQTFVPCATNLVSQSSICFLSVIRSREDGNWLINWCSTLLSDLWFKKKIGKDLEGSEETKKVSNLDYTFDRTLAYYMGGEESGNLSEE